MDDIIEVETMSELWQLLLSSSFSLQPPAPLNYPNYKGCLELFTFNERFVSLYNFQKAVNINVELPCKRYVQSGSRHSHPMVLLGVNRGNCSNQHTQNSPFSHTRKKVTVIQSMSRI